MTHIGSPSRSSYCVHIDIQLVHSRASIVFTLVPILVSIVNTSIPNWYTVVPAIATHRYPIITTDGERTAAHQALK